MDVRSRTNIGEIVHYVYNGRLDEAPAIVVRVHGEDSADAENGLVNLKVFTDSIEGAAWVNKVERAPDGNVMTEGINKWQSYDECPNIVE